MLMHKKAKGDLLCLIASVCCGPKYQTVSHSFFLIPCHLVTRDYSNLKMLTLLGAKNQQNGGNTFCVQRFRATNTQSWKGYFTVSQKVARHLNKCLKIWAKNILWEKQSWKVLFLCSGQELVWPQSNREMHTTRVKSTESDLTLAWINKLELIKYNIITVTKRPVQYLCFCKMFGSHNSFLAMSYCIWNKCSGTVLQPNQTICQANPQLFKNLPLLACFPATRNKISLTEILEQLRT